MFEEDMNILPIVIVVWFCAILLGAIAPVKKAPDPIRVKIQDRLDKFDPDFNWPGDRQLVKACRIAKTMPPTGRAARYQPGDQLLGFLNSLQGREDYVGRYAHGVRAAT